MFRVRCSVCAGSPIRSIFIPTRSFFMLARAETWWTILRISIAERLVYRTDFMLGTLMRFLPIVTQIFLWTAIFAATGKESIAGYTNQDFIAYYLLTMISRAFSSMPGLASGVARQIRTGEIKKFIIQPVDLIGFLFLSRIAHKLVYYLMALLPFALVFYLCRGYFNGWPPVETLLAFVASLVMAFLLGFFMETTIGMIGFWWLEVSSLLFVYMLLTFFLSGHMFPLEILSGVTLWGSFTCYDLVHALPLQYLAYFPAAVFLEKIEGLDLARGLVTQLMWVVFFILACRVALNRGLKRYSGFGG